MTTINIGKCRSLVEIEDVISKIRKSTEDDNFIFTLDSLNARHSPLHDASRLQMIVTLLRHKLHSEYINLHQNTSRSNAIQNTCNYSTGIAGVRLSRGIRIGSNIIERREALKSATLKMQATDAEDFSKIVHGRSLDLICVAGSKVQFLRPLFSGKGIVKNQSEMRNSMHKLVEFVNKESKDKIPLTLINSLGLFSRELIQNTQEHALHDHAGKPYIAHVEGMILGWTRLNEELFSADFSENTNLKKYWEKESNKTISGTKSLRVFSVSYFDSGPGLVSRYKNRLVTEMSLSEERQALLECLKHKSTSKPENAAGEGLPSVLKDLRKVGGLIRIRSGRLSMFNAFDTENPSRDLFDFEDWSNTELSPSEGAVLSILVPLRDE